MVAGARVTTGGLPHRGLRAVLRRRPGSPHELGARAWWSALKRALAEFKEDELTDRAAALTYYGVLSIFPAMLVVVSVVGLAGRSVSQSLIANVGDLAPGLVRQVLVTALRELQGGRAGAGLAAALGLLAALWSASGYVGAFIRAANAVYDIPEGRPVWKVLPIRLAITVVTLLLLAVSAVVVVVSGPLAERAGELLGLGPAAVTAWTIAKWPVLVLVAAFLISLLYWAAPNARHGFRWVTPGGVLAIALWLVASAGFALYVAGFASYNKTYGSLAGLIVFLVWLWLSNMAILLGAELNAELERGRAIAAGLPEESEPYVEPRDTRGFKARER
ncbi:hypothetical protein Acsp03_04360 [Actinomadura sp. NBRC 104412]|uniref:YihY/virulence factor BrkB family protein n=1 Tax=Actinomadura sp. NBRC 104412 TaxID=3032203 RepID=UPI0024A5B1E8|nr:YihY/virulence factor BrkB family protein [Actinomadura sp. NBRC 104412]GLZ02969.1 hypothetical protein Acsp03_04360 [Actinomadura sp. NBRC 104412]